MVSTLADRLVSTNSRMARLAGRCVGVAAVVDAYTDKMCLADAAWKGVRSKRVGVMA
jgi:hypothetical protein